MERSDLPFPFRFAQRPLPFEDRSGWRRLPTLKGLSRMSEEELALAKGGIACGLTAVHTTGTITNFGGRPDVTRVDTTHVLDNR